MPTSALPILGTILAALITIGGSVLVARLTGQIGALKRIERMADVAARLPAQSKRRLEQQVAKEVENYIHTSERVPRPVVIGSGVLVLVLGLVLFIGRLLVDEPVKLPSLVFVRVAKNLREDDPTISVRESLWVGAATNVLLLVVFLSLWTLAVYASRSLSRRFARWGRSPSGVAWARKMDQRHPVPKWVLSAGRVAGILVQVLFALFPAVYLVWAFRA